VTAASAALGSPQFPTNDKTAEAALFKKVKAGGKGVWGETPMPPNAHVKDEDINTLVHWILSLK
jgi:cytochrome c